MQLDDAEECLTLEQEQLRSGWLQNSGQYAIALEWFARVINEGYGR